MSGASPDLDAVVGVVVAWLQGESASDVSTKFPFVKAGELADINDDEGLINAQWQSLLVDEYALDERALVEAAYGNEHARSLFPMLSHGALRLSTDLGCPGGRVMRIVPLRHGGCRIEDEDGPVLATLDSLDGLSSLSVIADWLND
ncbi:DUF6193 family natural product biosynthesis protein [Krasilnikovia sp. MM14-A1259]|uniref:DUF6193 family natural product biosynthesis protein n=1 Tax=Krasilnikovia sp. MM14-A1259 TaxID=3373539 RepID=UPI00399C6EF9